MLFQAEATFNAQALKKQIMEYQRYVQENEALKSKCEGLSVKCELLREDCSLYERDREMLVEFGNEVAEQANEANNRALKAEENEKRVAADLEFYKHEYMIMKVINFFLFQILYYLNFMVSFLFLIFFLKKF